MVDVLARVFFVDWGNIEMLPIADLRELPQEFWKCQPVALPFKMDGLWRFDYPLNRRKSLYFHVYLIKSRITPLKKK